MSHVRCCSTLLVMVFLTACSVAPSSNPLAEKWHTTRDKAAQLFQECHTESAMAEYRKVLHLAELRDDKPGIATARLNLGTIHLVRGDFREAESQFTQARRGFEALNDAVSRLQSEINLATLQVRQGHFEVGVAAYQPLLRQLDQEKTFPPVFHVMIWNGLAVAYGGLDRYPEAHAALDQAEREARERGFARDLAATLMNRARIHFKQGALSVARQEVVQVLEMDRSLENLLGIGADLVLLGVIADREGETDSAQNHFRQASHIFDYCGLERSRIFSSDQMKYLNDGH